MIVSHFKIYFSTFKILYILTIVETCDNLFPLCFHMCSADGFEPVDIHWISRWSPASANLLVLIISIDNGGTTNVKIYLSMIAQVESNLLSYLIFSIPNIKKTYK